MFLESFSLSCSSRLLCRVLALLQQEGLRLSVQQVIVQRCCQALPMWLCRPGAQREDGAFSVSSLCVLLQDTCQEHMWTVGAAQPQADSGSESEDVEDEPPLSPALLSSSAPSSPSHSSSSSSCSSFLLSPSALAFLKARSPLLAALACLSACRGEAARTQTSMWSGYFRTSRKEAVLDGEQLSREADGLLKDFPILRAYLQAMAEPVLGAWPREGEDAPADLGAVLCGKPIISLLLSGPGGGAAQAVAAEAFQKALSSRDLGQALRLLELYGQGGGQQGALRDRLLACAALEGKHIRATPGFVASLLRNIVLQI